VDNYTDYIKFSGTRLVTSQEDIDKDPNQISDEETVPNADVLRGVVFGNLLIYIKY